MAEKRSDSRKRHVKVIEWINDIYPLQQDDKAKSQIISRLNSISPEYFDEFLNMDPLQLMQIGLNMIRKDHDYIIKEEDIKKEDE